jgi:hypothetical protein
MKNIGQYLFTLLTKSCGHNGMTVLSLLYALHLQIFFVFSGDLLICKLLYSRLFQWCPNVCTVVVYD